MGKVGKPRSGSMQFWPRVRAKRQYARIRAPNAPIDVKPALFAGYKVGMTHVQAIDNRKASPTKGIEVSYPVTVIECPPMKIMGVRFYKKAYLGQKVVADVYADKLEKEVLRKTTPSKKNIKLDAVNPDDFDDLKIIVHTNPKITGVEKKKPEVFEIAIGGKKLDKLNYVKENLGKDLSISDVFAEGVQLTLTSVTRGKGYQGPVKRFGVGLRNHKSEKVIRGPGSLGGWISQGHVMYRVAHAGKMGYHQRTEYNKMLLKISETNEGINVSGGYVGYGEVKSSYVLIKGSVAGSAKRLIMMTTSKRPAKNIPTQAPTIEEINLDSKQGR